MIKLDYKLLIIMISSCFLTNAHSLLTENNEAKTKDIDILRQLLNQESLFRITLTKDVENLKQRLLSEQDETLEKDHVPSENCPVLEERNFNSSLLQTLIEKVNGQKFEDIRDEISLQREQFSKLSANLTMLSVMILKGFERLENMSEQFSKLSDNFTMLSVKLLKDFERFENVSDITMQKSDAMDIKVETDLLDKRYRDCQEMLKQNTSLRNQNGVYTIYLGCNTPRKVFCDMTTNGGGWTVIQRRFDGSTDFKRGWKDYKEGFGDPNKEYWLGNDAVSDLTDGRNQELWIDLEKFAGSMVYARYSNFSVGSEKDKYRLSIAGYSGNAGDMMIQAHNLNGMYFTTKDRDNDKSSSYNCAIKYHTGGWWFNDCAYAGLNNVYQTSNTNDYKYLFWGTNRENMKSTKMMIRSN